MAERLESHLPRVAGSPRVGRNLGAKPSFWAPVSQLREMQDEQIQRDFGGSVWESNPRRHPAKLLNPFSRSRRVGRSWAQQFGYLFDRVALRIANHMRVNFERDPGIAMAQLCLSNLR